MCWLYLSCHADVRRGDALTAMHLVHTATCLRLGSTSQYPKVLRTHGTSAHSRVHEFRGMQRVRSGINAPRNMGGISDSSPAEAGGRLQFRPTAVKPSSTREVTNNLSSAILLKGVVRYIASENCEAVAGQGGRLVCKYSGLVLRHPRSRDH